MFYWVPLIPNDQQNAAGHQIEGAKKKLEILSYKHFSMALFNSLN